MKNYLQIIDPFNWLQLYYQLNNWLQQDQLMAINWTLIVYLVTFLLTAAITIFKEIDFYNFAFTFELD